MKLSRLKKLAGIPGLYLFVRKYKKMLDELDKEAHFYREKIFKAETRDEVDEGVAGLMEINKKMADAILELRNKVDSWEEQ